MNPSERSSHPSRAQIEALMEYLEENPSLAKGFSRVTSAREVARKKWQTFAVRLNSIGGSVKSWKQWTKYWADKKSAVKKKAALRSAAQQKTIGELDPAVELTEVEERILSVMGGEGLAVCDMRFATSQSQITTEDMQSALSQDVMESHVTEIPIIDRTEWAVVAATDLSLSMHPEANLDCVAGTSFPSNRPSFVQMIVPHPPVVGSAATPPPVIKSSPQTPPQACAPHHATSRGSSPTIPAYAQPPPRNNIPRRKRRLIQSMSSPSSQRRSQFSSLTERFLRLEEQRLELDQRNTCILENMSGLVGQLLERAPGRDLAVAQALASVGEGLKLLAKALNK